MADTQTDEQAFKEIWSAILGIDASSISLTDSFKELGGDSLKSMIVYSMIREKGFDISPTKFANLATIEQLITAVTSHDATISTISTHTEGLQNSNKLTPEQVWFFSETSFDYDRFNIPLLYKVEGTLDKTVLERSVNELVDRHQALRSSFSTNSGRWELSLVESPQYKQYCQYFDLSGFNSSDQSKLTSNIAESLQSTLSVSEGPLFRVAYFDFGEDSPGRLFVLLHHLVADGVSLGVVHSDLSKIYQSLSECGEFSTAIKPVQVGQILEHCKPYIANIDDANIALRAENILKYSGSIPVDFKSYSDNIVTSSADKTFTIPQELSNKLFDSLPTKVGCSPMLIALSAFGNSLLEWTNTDKQPIKLINSGRDFYAKSLDLDTTSTVGWLALSPTVFLNPTSFDHLKEYSKHIDNEVRQGLDYELYTCNQYWQKEDHTLPSINDNDKIVFNFLGELNMNHKISDCAKLSPAGESVGPNQSECASRACLMYCEVRQTNGEYTLRLNYSSKLYQESTIDKIMERFVAWLKKFSNSF